MGNQILFYEHRHNWHKIHLRIKILILCVLHLFRKRNLPLKQIFLRTVSRDFKNNVLDIIDKIVSIKNRPKKRKKIKIDLT